MASEMTLFDPLPPPAPPAGQPRLSRREILIPSYVLPQHHKLYTKLAGEFLAKCPTASAVEVERHTRIELENRI